MSAYGTEVYGETAYGGTAAPRPAANMFYTAPTSTDNGGFLSFAQAASTEIVIHNIYAGGAVEVYWYDGTNSIHIDGLSAAGSLQNVQFHCNTSAYIRVKNVSGGTIFIGADGHTTKLP